MTRRNFELAFYTGGNLLHANLVLRVFGIPFTFVPEIDYEHSLTRVMEAVYTREGDWNHVTNHHYFLEVKGLVQLTGLRELWEHWRTFHNTSLIRLEVAEIVSVRNAHWLEELWFVLPGIAFFVASIGFMAMGIGSCIKDWN